MLLGIGSPQFASADTAMTAGVVMKDMPVRERTSFIIGVVEGLAYARFRYDSATAGHKEEGGMNCIYNWLYKDTTTTMDRIESTFRKYEQHLPSVLLAAMIKKECGE